MLIKIFNRVRNRYQPIQGLKIYKSVIHRQGIILELFLPLEKYS